MPAASAADPSHARNSGSAARASGLAARATAAMTEQARALLMTGSGNPSDQLDGELLKAEVLAWLRGRLDRPPGELALLRAKCGYEALSQVSERISNSALKLAWNLVQAETVRYSQFCYLIHGHRLNERGS